jgi:hypothetical protein
MSRPPAHRIEHYTESPRCSSLKPFLQTIIDKVKQKEYRPTTNIEPIVDKNEKEHLVMCAEHFKNYVECREVNSEYICEPYREYMLKLKCI